MAPPWGGSGAPGPGRFPAQSPFHSRERLLREPRPLSSAPHVGKLRHKGPCGFPGDRDPNPEPQSASGASHNALLPDGKPSWEGPSLPQAGPSGPLPPPDPPTSPSHILSGSPGPTGCPNLSSAGPRRSAVNAGGPFSALSIPREAAKGAMSHRKPPSPGALDLETRGFTQPPPADPTFPPTPGSSPWALRMRGRGLWPSEALGQSSRPPRSQPPANTPAGSSSVSP